MSVPAGAGAGAGSPAGGLGGGPAESSTPADGPAVPGPPCGAAGCSTATSPGSHGAAPQDVAMAVSGSPLVSMGVVTGPPCESLLIFPAAASEAEATPLPPATGTKRLL